MKTSRRTFVKSSTLALVGSAFMGNDLIPGKKEGRDNGHPIVFST
jgi:hypothetical protein